MEQKYTSVHCNAGLFQRGGALTTNQNHCIGNEIPSPDHNIGSSPRSVERGELSQHFVSNEAVEPHRPTNSHQFTQSFGFGLGEPIDDLFNDEIQKVGEDDST